jgi:hypothetical protein
LSPLQDGAGIGGSPLRALRLVAFVTKRTDLASITLLQHYFSPYRKNLWTPVRLPVEIPEKYRPRFVKQTYKFFQDFPKFFKVKQTL